MYNYQLATLTPAGSVKLDNAYAPTQGLGNNGWMPTFEAHAWAFELVWTGGVLGPNGLFVVEGTLDAVIDQNGSAVADSALTIFAVNDDWGVELSVGGGGVAGKALFERRSPGAVRYVRVNYTGGGAGGDGTISKLVFASVALRDS